MTVQCCYSYATFVLEMSNLVKEFQLSKIIRRPQGRASSVSLPQTRPRIRTSLITVLGTITTGPGFFFDFNRFNTTSRHQPDASSLSSRSSSLSLSFFFSRGGGGTRHTWTTVAAAATTMWIRRRWWVSHSPHSSLSLTPTPFSLRWWNDRQRVVGGEAGGGGGSFMDLGFRGAGLGFGGSYGRDSNECQT
jgi:hypothetical protein